MRKNIALLALEEEDVIQDDGAVPTRVEAEDMQALETLNAEIASDQDVIEEAVETREAIGALADQVDAQEGGIDASGAALVEVAVEHFCARLGYPVKKLQLATEGFSEAGRREKSQTLVKNLRVAQESIQKQIGIAQEGLWDKIKNKFDRVFTTRKKLVRQLADASKRYDQQGKAEASIAGKHLSTYLNPEGKAEATGKDVVATLERVAKVYEDAETVKRIEQLIKVIDETIDVLAKSNTNPTGNELSKLVKLKEESVTAVAAFKQLFERLPAKAQEVRLAPCEPSEKAKLVKLCETTIINKTNDAKLETLWNKFDTLYGTLDRKVIVDRANALHELYNIENSVAAEIMQLADTVWNSVVETDVIAFNVAHSAVRYLELSTAK